MNARLVLLLALSACAFPADLGREITVTINSAPLALTVGDTLRVAGEVTRGGQPVAVPILFASSDLEVAVVDNDGLVRAVGVGTASITARAVGFETAAVADLPVQVLRPVRIDTVITQFPQITSATTVRWGEYVKVIGFGLNPQGALIVVGNQAPVIESFTAGDPFDTTTVDTLRLWIPALTPDPTSLVVARLGGAIGAQWPLRVVQADLYEPDDPPTDLGALTTPFFNPGLALEVVPPQQSPLACASVWSSSHPMECWFDQFFVSRPPGPLNDSMTIVFRFTRALQNSPVSIETQGVNGQQVWRIGRNFSLCLDFGGGTANRAIIHEFDALRDTFALALAGMAGRQLYLSATLFGWDASPEVPWPGEPTGTLPYQLAIYPGYRAALAPDVAEENDFCHGAFPLPLPGDTLDLTFDTGTDLDWFSFTIPAPVPSPGSRAPRQADVPESEPNNNETEADTVLLGDRVLGSIDPTGDSDYFVFHADSGEVLDLEVRADRNGSALNSLLVLWSDVGLLATGIRAATGTEDQRITVVAPATGWYTAVLFDEDLEGGPGYTYELTISPASTLASLVTAEVCCSTRAAAGFNPQLQLFADNRASAGSVALIAERDASFQFPLLPGKYFLLVYNRTGDATGYQLRFTATAPQPAPPLAPRSALPALLANPRALRSFAPARAAEASTSLRRPGRRAGRP